MFQIQSNTRDIRNFRSFLVSDNSFITQLGGDNDFCSFQNEVQCIPHRVSPRIKLHMLLS